MDPSQILFDVISSLTGGLITDLQTALVGLLSLSFLAMGFDMLKDKFLDYAYTVSDRYRRTGRFTVPRVGKLEMEKGDGTSQEDTWDPSQYEDHQINDPMTIRRRKKP